MNLNMIFIIIIIIIIIILSLKNEYFNSMFVEVFSPINYIKYNDFEKKYELINTKKIPIYIFFHLCPKSENNTHITIINEQINDFITSGLYEECECILYGCNCDNCDIFLDNFLKNYSKFKKLSNAISPNTKSYENMTINSMLEFAKNSNTEFYGLYFHTKGTTSKSDAQHSWRIFMSYFLIKNYKLCIDILNRGFYTCGVNYLIYPKHYSGNFFWFNSNYLRNLNYIIDIEDRVSAEYWLFGKYVQDKHISIYKNRYLNMCTIINTGLYYFSIDFNKDVNNIDIAIV